MTHVGFKLDEGSLRFSLSLEVTVSSRGSRGLGMQVVVELLPVPAPARPRWRTSCLAALGQALILSTSLQASLASPSLRAAFPLQPLPSIPGTDPLTWHSLGMDGAGHGWSPQQRSSAGHTRAFALRHWTGSSLPTQPTCRACPSAQLHAHSALSPGKGLPAQPPSLSLERGLTSSGSPLTSQCASPSPWAQAGPNCTRVHPGLLQDARETLPQGDPIAAAAAAALPAADPQPTRRPQSWLRLSEG